jgi:hypothetical protein
MNDALASLCFFSFFAMAPALLIVKLTTSRPAWRLILIMIIVLGWGLVVGTYIFSQLGISDLIAQGKEEELPEGWDSDGASGLTAIFGGWLLSLAYFAPWLVIYFLAAMTRRFFKSGHAPNKAMHSDAATPRR